MSLLPRTLCLFLFITISTSIQIPLKQSQYKCMLIYSMFNNETVKLDINFPHLLNWHNEDKYYITLRNTKTEHTQSQSLEWGHYRREINIYESTSVGIVGIIYEICFEFISPRQVTQEILVEYEAGTHYMLDKSQIKLPETLLKQEHLMESYNNAVVLNRMVEQLVEMQKIRGSKEAEQYQETEKVERKIIVMTVIEIAIILAGCVYQFCSLKKKINGNAIENYI